MLERPDIGLWVVADGMGGHSAGDLASGMIVERLEQLNTPTDLNQFLDEAERTVLDVNVELRKMARQREAHMIGSTIISLLAPMSTPSACGPGTAACIACAMTSWYR